jgi:hypothetical protein
MSSIADGTVRIQTSSQSLAAPPSWFGEVVLLSASLRQHGVLTKISEQVRFARRRFGHDEVIDFLAILFARLCPYYATKASVSVKRSNRARGISTISDFAGDMPKRVTGQSC